MKQNYVGVTLELPIGIKKISFKHPPSPEGSIDMITFIENSPVVTKSIAKERKT